MSLMEKLNKHCQWHQRFNALQVVALGRGIVTYRKRLQSELANLQLLESHRTETLELIVEKGIEFGYTDLVAEAEEMLESRAK